MRAGTTSYSARSSWQMAGSREKRKEYRERMQLRGNL